MKDKIDVPFGAHDSELCGFEYTIPEGMEAEIKDGKVIVRKKDANDEKPKVDLVEQLRHHLATTPKEQLEKEWKDLEKWNDVGPTVEEYLYGHKRPVVDLEMFKSFMLQYLQDAANRKDDSEIESDTDKWAKKLIELIYNIQLLNYRDLLMLLLDAIDYSFARTDGTYDRSLSYPVIDKVNYIKKQLMI